MQKPVLISGFDDVLRQAGNTGLVRAGLKLLSSDATYTGMPQLYHVLTAEESGHPRFFLVSAIAALFRRRIERFLAASGYPSFHPYLSNWITDWPIARFKMDRVRQVLAQRPGRPFIAVFDNSRPSIVLADRLFDAFPGTLAAVYLRQTVQRDVPRRATGFFTAFDIAWHEYRAGRLNPAELDDVARPILAETDAGNLIPSYAHCPQEYEPCPGGEVSPEVCTAVRNKVRSLCDAR